MLQSTIELDSYSVIADSIDDDLMQMLEAMEADDFEQAQDCSDKWID